jgi:hypothetical protein
MPDTKYNIPESIKGLLRDKDDEIAALREEIKRLREKVKPKFEDFVMRNKDESVLGYIEEDILAYLLKEDVAFVNSREYLCIDGETKQPETLVIFVNCNDIWAWACAEGLEITLDELPELCEMYMKDSGWGAIKWACKKRNMRPQKPIRDDMKKDNAWCDMMESLDPNYDEIQRPEGE